MIRQISSYDLRIRELINTKKSTFKALEKQKKQN